MILRNFKNKVKCIVVLFILLVLADNAFAGTNIQHHELIHNKRVGITTLFPKPLGMFFDNRAFLFYKKNKNCTSLFPDKKLKFKRDINQELIHNIREKLTSGYKTSRFIELPALSPETHLTGYFIEGWWGEATKSIHVKGLKILFKKHDLDYIVAIVPVTYYLPAIKSEASGLNLSFAKDKLFFSATYAILLFSKNSSLYEKSYSSIKQVYIKSFKNPKSLGSTKTYGEEHLKLFYSAFENDFIPHLNSQIIMLLANTNCKNIFFKPREPLHYLLPH